MPHLQLRYVGNIQNQEFDKTEYIQDTNKWLHWEEQIKIKGYISSYRYQQTNLASTSLAELSRNDISIALHRISEMGIHIPVLQLCALDAQYSCRYRSPKLPWRESARRVDSQTRSLFSSCSSIEVSVGEYKPQTQERFKQVRRRTTATQNQKSNITKDSVQRSLGVSNKVFGNYN